MDMAYTADQAPKHLRVSRSRRSFLKGGAAAGLLAVMASGGSSAQAAGFAKANLQDLSDLDILNFALTLEHLENRFYKDGLEADILSGQARTIAAAIQSHEQAHVDALTKALTDADYGDIAEELDEYNFGAVGDVNNAAGFLAVAEVLEQTGVGAYTGAGALLDSKDILAVAASIEQVEARHQGAIRWLNDKNPSSGVLGPVLTVAETLKAVGPIIGS